MVTGIFGGSFDPIHVGHAMLANMLSQWHGLDRVWLMPSRLNPLKIDSRKPAPDADRIAMCRLVAERCANVEVCDIEMQLPLPSYTYTTLTTLRDLYPDEKFRLIIGSDNWQIFGQWRQSEKIIREFGVVIYVRPGYPVTEELPSGVTLIENMPQVQVSSTLIRELIRKGENVNFLVPSEVIDYIQDNELYHGDERDK